MTNYRNANAKLNEMRTQLEKHNIYISTYSPGDGVTRYRFHLKPSGYFQDDGFYTACGLKEAETFKKGLMAGIYHATNPKDLPK